MKAAVVLYADTMLLKQQAGGMNEFIHSLRSDLSEIEMWVFYQGQKPAIVPGFRFSVSRILFIAVEPPPVPEVCLTLLEDCCDQHPMDLIVFPGTDLGEHLATRMAYRLNGSACLKTEKCRVKPGVLEVSRPVYENNLAATFELAARPFCLSLAKKAGKPVQMENVDFSMVLEPDLFAPPKPDWIKECVVTPDLPGRGLADADIVLVAGQGIRTKKKMEFLERTAAALGAELGASRPVVMNAWTGLERLIGASGLIVSPKLCIAVGVSGAGFFTLGIKDSEFIVAVNTDVEAPIFQVADVGIVDDLTAILEALAEIVTTAENKGGPHTDPDLNKALSAGKQG